MEISLTNPDVWASFVTLTALEIVLGIDNVVFLSLILGRVDEKRRKLARQLGLGLALIFRILLLLGLVWVIGLTKPFMSVFGYDFSWRDIILISGGLFLMAKATIEIHHGIEHRNEDVPSLMSTAFLLVILQIVAIDLVFSLDSIITAIGIAKHVEVMVAAILIAMVVMYVAADPVSRFIERHPTTKMLALSFLLLIGMALVADGLHSEIERGYIYFAMVFASLVEGFNVLASRPKPDNVDGERPKEREPE